MEQTERDKQNKMLASDQELLEVAPALIAYGEATRQSTLPLHQKRSLTSVGRRIREQLSPKELCIGRLLVAEGSNRAIACKVGTSVETVKCHLVNMFHKVGVQDRLSLAMTLIRHGVIACPCLVALEHEQECSVECSDTRADN